MMRPLIPSIAMLLAGVLLLSPFAVDVSLAASKIGVASAVKNDVEGIQGGSSRILATGSSVFEQEQIRTGAQSVAQLLFIDQTSLSVGPLSDVTLDRFVYDPARNTGDVLLSTTKGAFRFISGSQNPLNYKISTPSATIGVRGTIVNVIQSDRLMTIIADEGTVVVEVGGIEYTLNAGQAMAVGPGGKVTGPFTFDGVPGELAFGMPWPLFPSALETETWDFEVPDDTTVRLDDLMPPEMIDQEPDDNCQLYECECYPCDQILR